ncbi:PEP/pyruvate-binding domain-containing protein [Bacillus velezensis]|nr:PEP/pyruvate-binding domain-containing protein [Bacillus velezensis]
MEKDLGGPQDIEWAAAGGTLYILQSRPITTLQAGNLETYEWNDSFSGDFMDKHKYRRSDSRCDDAADMVAPPESG